MVERAKKPWPSFAREFITSYSTSVTSFGNPFTATFATIGINPNTREFLSREKKPREPHDKLFCDYLTLGKEEGVELTDSDAFQIIESCHSYFDSGKSITDFFKINSEFVLENVSKKLQYGKNAVHLDLIQWSTNPDWGDLPVPVRRKMLEEDAEFLEKQIEHGNFKAIYLNGRTVIETFQEAFFPLDLMAVDSKSNEIIQSRRPRRLASNSFYIGKIQDTLIIGYTQFIGKRRSFNANWLKEQLKFVSKDLEF